MFSKETAAHVSPPLSKIESHKDSLPPHHQTKPLHIPQIQRLRILLIPPAIRRAKLLKTDLVRAPPRHKVILPAHARLIPPVLALPRQRVLEDEGVLLAVGGVDADGQPRVAAQVEAQLADGALRREARAAERLRVEIAAEGGALRGEEGQVRDGGAAADAVVGGGPEGGVPRSDGRKG